MTATPLDLIERLAAVLARHHADAQLAGLLAAMAPHITDRPRPDATSPHVGVDVVTHLHRLLGRVDLVQILPEVLDAAAPYLHGPDSEDLDRVIAGAEGLSGRELEVLTRIAQGRTNASIGRELGVSEQAIKSRVKNVLAKLAAHDRAHAVARGYQLGYLPTPARRVHVISAA